MVILLANYLVNVTKLAAPISQIEINIMVYERYKRPFISTMKGYVEREQYLMEFNCYIYLLGAFTIILCIMIVILLL